MELEEVKNIWQKYDKALSKGVEIHEGLLRYKVLNTSIRSETAFLFREVVSGVTTLIILVWIYFQQGGAVEVLPSLYWLLIAAVYSIYAAFSYFRVKMYFLVRNSDAPICLQQQYYLKFRRQKLRYIVIKAYLAVLFVGAVLLMRAVGILWGYPSYNQIFIVFWLMLLVTSHLLDKLYYTKKIKRIEEELFAMQATEKQG